MPESRSVARISGNRSIWLAFFSLLTLRRRLFGQRWSIFLSLLSKTDSRLFVEPIESRYNREPKRIKKDCQLDPSYKTYRCKSGSQSTMHPLREINRALLVAYRNCCYATWISVVLKISRVLSRGRPNPAIKLWKWLRINLLDQLVFTIGGFIVPTATVRKC